MTASMKVITEVAPGLVPADRERAIIEGIEEITRDLDQKQGAMVMTTDISFVKGSMNMMKIRFIMSVIWNENKEQFRYH
jgi:hypothetical protein